MLLLTPLWHVNHFKSLLMDAAFQILLAVLVYWLHGVECVKHHESSVCAQIKAMQFRDTLNMKSKLSLVHYVDELCFSLNSVWLPWGNRWFLTMGEASCWRLIKISGIITWNDLTRSLMSFYMKPDYCKCQRQPSSSRQHCRVIFNDGYPDFGKYL